MYALVEGKKYPIVAGFEDIAEYFKEVKAISPETFLFELPPTRVTRSIWECIQAMLEDFDFRLPEVPRVKSMNPGDHLHRKLVEQLSSMSLPELNALYQAAHYLKIRAIKRSIAAFLGCRVYICAEGSYGLRRAELQVGREISSELMESSYKAHNPGLS